MKEKLVSKEEIQSIHPVFKGWFGNLLIKFLCSVGGINKVNAIYDASKHQPNGWMFSVDLLDRQGIFRQVENIEVLEQFKDKAFITVSNHPYGHIDGIMAISILAGERSDFKMMVNWMLNRIDTMSEHFIGVNPYDKNTKLSAIGSSFSGIKACIAHLKDGHPLGLFPAGGVSLPKWKGEPEDREWQASVLKLIKKVKVPVIPMYISGNNSWFYRFLGLIDWRVRMFRLLHEVTNKRGKTIHIRFGKPISVEEQAQYEDIKAFGEYLKAQTYSLKNA